MVSYRKRCAEEVKKERSTFSKCFRGVVFRGVIAPDAATAALDADSVPAVFASDVAGQDLDQRRTEGRSHRCLTREKAARLERCAGSGKTLSVEQLLFSTGGIAHSVGSALVT